MTLKYPRKELTRKLMTGVGRILLAGLADVRVNGRERLPKNGPVILAGNHVAALEAALMAVYTPGNVEFLGNGDIPFDPNYAFIANAYGLIPINRGNLDREGMQMALDVLSQDGLLGIFPEGGTWAPDHMQAQIGVAWLSYKSQAPVLPIGFGGIQGGLTRAFKLQRPTLTMNVGELIPPVQNADTALSARAHLEAASEVILSRIKALIPENDLADTHRWVDERFHLEIELYAHGARIPLPDAHQASHGAAYARLLFNPTLLDVLVRNLRLPIKPLKQVRAYHQLGPILTAWRAISDYLEHNPGFFTYRFGVDEGLAVGQALQELAQLGAWAHAQGYRLALNPVRRYRNGSTGARVTEWGGCFPRSM